MTETSSDNLTAETPEARHSVPLHPIPIEEMLTRIHGVSTLPHVALRVMEVARDPDSGAKDVRAIVETDPSLSARVLKCINSAAYGMRSTVTNLQQAIAYLGFNQVRNLAITASVAEIFKCEEPIGPYQRPALWRHLVSVGICARMIARRKRVQAFEDAFLAGLLHDLGIVLIDQYAHPHFVAVIRGLTGKEGLSAVERSVLGFDHAVLGRRVAEAWKFPQAVGDAMRFHHIPQNYRGEFSEIVYCVALGNLICTLKDITSVGIKLTEPPRAAMDGLAMSVEDLKVLATDLDHELELNRQLLEL